MLNVRVVEKEMLTCKGRAGVVVVAAVVRCWASEVLVPAQLSARNRLPILVETSAEIDRDRCNFISISWSDGREEDVGLYRRAEDKRVVSVQPPQIKFLVDTAAGSCEAGAEGWEMAGVSVVQGSVQELFMLGKRLDYGVLADEAKGVDFEAELRREAEERRLNLVEGLISWQGRSRAIGQAYDSFLGLV